MIEAAIKRALAAHGKMRIEQLVSAMDEAATTDIRCYALWPILKQVLGRPADPQLQHAIASIDSWYADGCHRRDLTNHDNTKPGVYQHNDAITIMDAWYPQLLDAMFGPALGADAFGSLHGMLDFGAVTPGVPAAGGYPDFSDGWYGYVSKDLRDLLAPRHVTAAPARCRVVRRRVRRGRHLVTRRVRVCPQRAKRHVGHAPARRPARRAGTAALSAATAARLRHRRGHRSRPAPGVRGPYSRIYCGGGSLPICRQALQSSLRAALGVSPKQLYGIPDCASNPQASCYDENTSTSVSGISIPRFPWQNRPTFQQVVELTQKLGR
jgi:hypothetical protein